MSKNITPLLIFLAVLFAGVFGIFYLSNQKATDSNQLNLIPTIIPTATIAQTTTSAIINPPDLKKESTQGAKMDNYITTATGLKMFDEKVGDGKEVKTGDTVTVNYLGTLENGTKFDSSYDRNQPFTTQIGVGRVIKGWDEGIVGMKVGGKRKLLVPSDLAYGPQAVGSIPANSPLVFEVELLDVK